MVRLVSWRHAPRGNVERFRGHDGAMTRSLGWDRARADEFAARLARRRDELETDADHLSSPPNVAAVAAERALGRIPEAQAHSNPGFDVLSVDPETGTHYFIEVKGHLPRTTELSVSAQQVQKARSNPERWRLAVVSVPDDPDSDPEVHYLLDPFHDYTLHFA